MSTMKRYLEAWVPRRLQFWLRSGAHVILLIGGYTLNTEALDRRRRLLRIILSAILVVNIFVFFSALSKALTEGATYNGMPLVILGILVLFYGGLLYATHRGYGPIAAHILVLLFFTGTLYGTYHWGASMPNGLLAYALIITIASITISGWYGLVITLASIVSIVVIGIHEQSLNIVPEWKQEVVGLGDVIVYAVMIACTAVLSWLSNKEIEKSLHRAQHSEAELKIERDNLEATVEKRTQELKQAQLERSVDLARFAEFGKLSAGIFHDLINPLTAVSLSMNSLQNETAQLPAQRETQAVVDNAVQAAKRLQNGVERARKHINHKEHLQHFHGETELDDIVSVLNYQARQQHVTLVLESTIPIILYGDPLKFYQACTNLILNAIESFQQIPITTSERRVTITTRAIGQEYELTITDTGAGIDVEILKRIFDPFFTTKDKGIGLGLATTKDIIENHFSGSISCTSEIGHGTTFILRLPQPTL